MCNSGLFSFDIFSLSNFIFAVKHYIKHSKDKKWKFYDMYMLIIQGPKVACT